MGPAIELVVARATVRSVQSVRSAAAAAATTTTSSSSSSSLFMAAPPLPLPLPLRLRVRRRSKSAPNPAAAVHALHSLPFRESRRPGPSSSCSAVPFVSLIASPLLYLYSLTCSLARPPAHPLSRSRATLPRARARALFLTRSTSLPSLSLLHCNHGR